MKWIVALLALLATAAVMAGCGGGGGGGGGGSSTPNYVYSGKVVTGGSPSQPIPGDTVSFDGNGQYVATTNASGAFSLSVPASIVTSTDTLIVTSGNTQVAVYALPAGNKGVANITIQGGPPPPPF